MIQLTIIKIIGYGPWTLTQGSDREHRLQMLQASMYGRLQDLFSQRGGLLFLNRSDEYFAITNGMGPGDHAGIQDKMRSEFEVRLAMSVGEGATPYGANLVAFEAKKGGRLADPARDIYGSYAQGPTRATVMHMDVEDLAGYRKARSPYDTSNMIFSLHARLSDFFLERKSLAFFLGGDNFMIISADGAAGAAQQCIDEMGASHITLNCGIGNAPTGRDAARLATKSLDTIREIRDSGRTDRPYTYELSC